ncbi:hypothetical protein TNCV_1434781 [Trichonephila clavipes]|nr:hypothetical protein TNCV_1434781 [Trichonephila clavipes]
MWHASHHQKSENYWEGRPAQPPGVGEAFEKLFCWPFRPAAPDGGLNLACSRGMEVRCRLRCPFRRLITVQIYEIRR